MHSPYSGVRDCVVRMLREEGIGAFYKSYKITVRNNLIPGSERDSLAAFASV